ncbi:methyltransferase domain-containing protein [Amycolatopsis sp. cmx-4-61]|uniref:methyltransferase domain-containing protein n=1 Tax=Amycolatopsis sp. cmx-4-61 TaxID=2790937 RepID=UPI00397A88C2
MTAPVSTGHEFDRGLLGHRCWLELANGERIELPVERWAGPSEGDDVLLDACAGPTIDLGCGPGRLTAALAGRGVVALGVDSSRTAVRLTRRRGGSALQRNLFDRLPGEGRWRHALLADGNIGIGGDPAALLRRTARLIAPGGDVLVEVEPPGQGLRHERVRLRPGHADVAWFTWAWVGVDAIAEVAARAGLRVDWTTRRGHRWFARLEQP